MTPTITKVERKQYGCWEEAIIGSVDWLAQLQNRQKYCVLFYCDYRLTFSDGTTRLFLYNDQTKTWIEVNMNRKLTQVHFQDSTGFWHCATGVRLSEMLMKTQLAKCGEQSILMHRNYRLTYDNGDTEEYVYDSAKSTWSIKPINKPFTFESFKADLLAGKKVQVGDFVYWLANDKAFFKSAKGSVEAVSGHDGLLSSLLSATTYRTIE